MFLIESESSLLQAFRPIDRPYVEVPKDLKFPVKVLDYLAWMEPSGCRVFLVLSEGSTRKPLGVAFRRDQASGGAGTSRLCDWCHSTGASDAIGLLTATASQSKRVGVHACLDLRCVERLENQANLGGHNPRLLAHRLVARMAQFARQTLF